VTHHMIHAVFDREDDLLRAADTALRAGWRIVDIYSPYPLHATAHLLGLARSRLPRAAFVFGALGVALALWFQFWVSAWSWPLNVGGRPWNSLPAFVPVTFEMMVLCAGLGAVLLLLIVCRLYPGKAALVLSRKVTDSCFVLAVEGPGSDAATMRRLLLECQASGVEESECA
jgi:Protein of unknown function (DUF3341)